MNEKVRQFNHIYTLPMKSTDSDIVDDMEYPCYVQPFIQGVRCLYNPMRGFWNGRGIPFVVNLDHLKWESIYDITLDGVLTLPQGYTHRQTISATSRQNRLTPLLEYHIFDLVLYGTFEGRWNTFWKDYWDDECPKYDNKPQPVVRTPTYPIDNSNELEETIRFLLDREVIQEHIILRLNSCEYEMGQMNKDLRRIRTSNII